MGGAPRDELAVGDRVRSRWLRPAKPGKKPKRSKQSEWGTVTKVNADGTMNVKFKNSFVGNKFNVPIGYIVEVEGRKDLPDAVAEAAEALAKLRFSMGPKLPKAP